MKKLCLAVAAAALSLLMPLCAMAAPDMTGSVINVTAADAQALLDGEFGSINGKTINFTQDVTVVLDLARPTAHAGSGTLYRRYNISRIRPLTALSSMAVLLPARREWQRFICFPTACILRIRR